MKRITTPTAVPNMFGPGKPGFRDGNLSTGVAPTDFAALWFNHVQEELAAIAEAGGLTLNDGFMAQVLQALVSGKLWYGVDTGAANAYVLTITGGGPLVDGMRLCFKASSANTGAATLSVNGLGAAPILGPGQEALQGYEIVPGGLCTVVWNAGNWILLSSTGGLLQVRPATASRHAVQLGQINAPIAASQKITTINTTVTCSVTFTAPGPGVLLAFGSRNNGTVTAGTNSSTLYINGNIVGFDDTQVSMMHFGMLPTTGGVVSAAYNAAASVSFTASVMLVFIPNL